MQRTLQLMGERPLADQLAGAFSDMLDEARARARDAVESPGPALHDYRRAIRRAQAVVALTWPVLRKRPRRLVAEGLARATRRTRTLRDLDAVLPVLAKLEAGELGAEDASALVALRGFIEAAQAELASSEITAWRLRKNVRALAGLEEVFRVALHQWIEPDMLLEGLRDQYRETRRRFRAAHASGRVGDLHAWRKAGRALRYQLELLATARDLDAGIASLHATFEKQVKQLGQVTDLMALAIIAGESEQEVLGVDPAGLVDKLEALAEARATAAFLDAEPTFVIKPKSFAWPAERALPETSTTEAPASSAAPIGATPDPAA